MTMEIEDLFAGSNIFITGASGFVGLCLLEKLLRCIPDIKSVYILLRPKRNKTVYMRLHDIIQDEIFNTLKEQQGLSPLKKVIPVTGDIAEENLGLNIIEENELINKVDFVFHCAALLDFKENFKNTINTNLLGTRRLVELSKRMNHLKGIVHVSTAYVNPTKRYVKEIIYPIHVSVEKIIKLLYNLNDGTLQRVKPIILNGHPNFYTLSKSLAEIEISKISNLVPTAIVRPSMITGSWKEPVPGWTNSKNGPQGFIMAAAKGIVRRLPVDKGLVYDYIPVDVVINEIIASAWYIAQRQPSESLILHCTTSTCIPFKWSFIEEEIPKMLYNYPLKSAIWYPSLKLLPSMTMFRISAVIFHMIPAYILDFLSLASGGNAILVRLHKNINKSLEALTPFIFTEWKFDNSNTLILQESLSTSDKVKFGVDIRNIDWKDYFNNLALGVRQYLNKETPDSIPAGKKRLSTLWLLNICLQIFITQAFCFLFCLCSGSSLFSSSLFIIPAIVSLLTIF